MGRSLAAGAPPNFRATATCRHRFRLGYGENQIGQVLPEGAESGRSDQLAEEPLIVLKPHTAGTATAPSDPALTDARARGIWYNSGAAYTAADQIHHCSPVVNAATPTTATAPLPTNSNTWPIPEGKATAKSPEATLTRSP